MASPHFACPLPLLRGHSNFWPLISRSSMLQVQDLRPQKWSLRAVSKKNTSSLDVRDASNEESADNASKSTRRAPRRSRKKVTVETPEESSLSIVGSGKEEERSIPVTSDEATEKKSTRRGRTKATFSPSMGEDGVEQKVTRRKTRKRTGKLEEQSLGEELSTPKEHMTPSAQEGEEEELLLKDDVEDISFTYSWPPLVCCFGAAQHAFIPFGRPANRLIDHQIHESMTDMFWSPAKFVRAPGGSPSSVAIALASLGGRVEFMGKLGDDEYGQSMLYHLNVNKVQTRSIKIDTSKRTAISHMKIMKRGGLRMSCVKPCAEDSLLSSEVNIDVLREAKMFYFNSSSLLDPNMRLTTLRAIKISRKVGAVIFFDPNLPLPLWHSSTETKEFIQLAWNSADIIEVTKQELEFLWGIKPSEKFDTKDNDKLKFVHYKQEVIMPLWHENLKVLFVTNGTSKIHYYTEKDNGSVHGMEDAPITPFTGDMSVAGDAIVAALMRMLVVQPHLTTDKGYLEHMIKYAIDCGVIDQWLLARTHGFPPKEGMEVLTEEAGSMRSITEREYGTVVESVG